MNSSPWKPIIKEKLKIGALQAIRYTSSLISGGHIGFWWPSCIFSNAIFSEMNSLTLKTYKLKKKWTFYGFHTQRYESLLLFGGHLIFWPPSWMKWHVYLVSRGFLEAKYLASIHKKLHAGIIFWSIPGRSYRTTNICKSNFVLTGFEVNEFNGRFVLFCSFWLIMLL